MHTPLLASPSAVRGFSDVDGQTCGTAVQTLSMSLGHWVKFVYSLKAAVGENIVASSGKRI